MKSTSHIGFWIILALVGIFVVPFLVSAENLLTSLKREQASIARVFGDHYTDEITSAANLAHSLIFGATGVQAGLNNLQHTQDDMKLAHQVGSNVATYFAQEADSKVRALSVQLYSVILRLIVLLAWLLILLPFVVAVIFDGFQMRHVKFASLGHQNPTAFSLGFHITILLCAVPLLSIIIPTYVVTPLFMPFWVIATALPFSFAIRHTQPIFTR
jgi:hypothetical protein